MPSAFSSFTASFLAQELMPVSGLALRPRTIITDANTIVAYLQRHSTRNAAILSTLCGSARTSATVLGSVLPAQMHQSQSCLAPIQHAHWTLNGDCGSFTTSTSCQ